MALPAPPSIMDMDFDDEPIASYKWEATQQQAWDTEIVEDDSGNLRQCSWNMTGCAARVPRSGV